MKKLLAFILSFLLAGTLIFAQQTNDLVPYRKAGKWGYCKLSGQMVIKPVYDTAHFFFNNLSAVKINGKYGFINRTGKLVIPAIYSSIDNFNDGTSYVERNGQTYSLDTIGNEAEAEFATLDEVMAADDSWDNQSNVFEKFKENGKIGFYCRKAENREIAAIYDDVKFDDNFAIVAIDSKKGLLDLKGNELLPCDFQDIKKTYNSVFCVQKGNKWGISDTSGLKSLNFLYDTYQMITSTEFLVSVNQHFGLIDKSGERIPPVYQRLNFQNKDLVFAMKDGNWGLINLSNKILADFVYSSISWINYSSLYVIKNNKCGVLNITGQAMVPCDYDTLIYIPCDKPFNLLAKKDKLWGVINSENQTIIPFKYTDLKYKSLDYRAMSESYSCEEGFTFYRGKWCGYLNLKGKETIQPKYADVCGINNSHLVLVKTVKNKYGFVNKDTGKEYFSEQ